MPAAIELRTGRGEAKQEISQYLGFYEHRATGAHEPKYTGAPCPNAIERTKPG
jgi:hypothetical protein